MPELELFEQLKDEPLALMVLGAMIFYKILGAIIKYIPPLFTKTKKKSIEEILAEHYEYIKEASIKAGIAVVWTQGVPLIELFEAAISNIRMGANGNLKEKLVEAIIHAPDGVSIWKSVLGNYLREHGHNVSEHFSNTIEWIEKRIV